MTMVSTTADQYETSPRAGVNAIHFPTIQFRLFHCLTVCGRNVPRNIAMCQQKERTTRLNACKHGCQQCRFQNKSALQMFYWEGNVFNTFVTSQENRHNLFL